MADKETLETIFIIATASGEVDYLGDFYDYLDALALINDFLDAPRRFFGHLSASFRTQNGDKIPKSWAEKYQVEFPPRLSVRGNSRR